MHTKILKSFAKINISLRVTKLRDDGYHSLCSLFWKYDAGEFLRVRESGGDADKISGIEIEGENIVEKALKFARAEGFAVPFLDVQIFKKILPGMGMGAGSGNAGAILSFVEELNGKKFSHGLVARKVGADVPFFLAGESAAMVSGIGDEIEPAANKPILKIIPHFPAINCCTKNAYKMLDEFYDKKYPLDDEGARNEIFEISNSLFSGERVGLLPNDFAPPLMEKHPEYQKFFDEAEAAGALAWGITGSGAAMFSAFLC